MNSKLFPWYLAQARKSIVAFITIPLVISETYWTTWAAAYHP